VFNIVYQQFIDMYLTVIVRSAVTGPYSSQILMCKHPSKCGAQQNDVLKVPICIYYVFPFYLKQNNNATTTPINKNYYLTQFKMF